MKRIKVSFSNIKEIIEFNKVINTLSFDMVVAKGRWRVDAKSLMGLFSLDLSEPIQIYFNTEHYDEVMETLGKWTLPIEDSDRLYMVGEI